MNRLALLLGLAALLSPVALASAADLSRGPAEIRDSHLLAQARLTLPAVGPGTLRPGTWAVAVSAHWANSFSWTQDVAGEAPEDRRFLIDGEALVLDATVRRGLGRNVDVALRVPLQWRGGGALDGFIDWWHRVAQVPDGQRPHFLKNAFRFEGRTTEGPPFSWSDDAGTGLGNVELETRYRVRDGMGTSASAALVGRVSLPTGTGPFAGHGFAAGGQLVADFPLGRSFDLYAGLGFTAQDPGPVRGIAYAPLRGHGFVALEWRAARRLRVVAETSAASRLVENVDSYPGLHWVVNVTGRIDVGSRARLDVGFTENILSQLATTDFALFVGLALRP